MSVVEQAQRWLAQDPDPDTRRELEALIREGDSEELRERFHGALEFGTAGLRGLLGAGPNRMNRVTVSRTTAGLGEWLLREVPDAPSRGVCVGRDARERSHVFERDVVEVLLGFGIRVWLFSDVVPTPVVAFAVRERQAAAGVVITASHNPPGYNGYKVYWENGAQIVPPHDRGIAGAIERAKPMNEIERVSVDEGRAAGLVFDAEPSRHTYVESISALASDPSERSPVRIAYTALHGVAEKTFRRVLAAAKFDDVQSVPEQAEPDGRFPTVAFPNPEEPGAMDRVTELAREVDADLAIANDPDGDRVAAAVACNSRYELLSGNEIGLLLADDLLRRAEDGRRTAVLSTIVSSPLLGRIAAAHGARWEQTLTGHKWLQNRAIELEEQGLKVVFAYEEALGYAPSRLVRDKDGISSGLLLADLAARLGARKKTLLDMRRRLWAAHGYVADRQVSVRFDGTDADARMSARVERWRSGRPTAIGGFEVIRVRDFQEQTEWTPRGVAPMTGLARSNVLAFDLDGGHQVMLRPSGTEPKLKHYLYAEAPPDAAEDEAKRMAAATLDRLAADFTDPSDC